MNKEQAENVRGRRLLSPVPVSKSAQLFALPVKFATDGFRGLMLDWIADYTVGEFYLSSTVLYFCNEQDAMAYKLYDARDKCEMFNKLRKKEEAQAKLQGLASALQPGYVVKFK